MTQKYKKVGEQLEVVCTTDSTNLFDYDTLINQRAAIINSRDAELLVVETLIAKCVELGITSKIVDINE